jgi:hypothetical protein
MVRRILPDSDFESEDDHPQHEASGSPASSSHDSTETDASSSSTPPARPVRRIVRHKDYRPEPAGTYDYDSDIYTDESSIGSFIVSSDEEEEQPLYPKSCIQLFSVF